MTSIPEHLPDYEETPPYTPHTTSTHFISTNPTFTPSILNISPDGTHITCSTSLLPTAPIYTFTSPLISAGPTTAIRIHRVDTHSGNDIPVYVIAEHYARPLNRGISSLSSLEISQSRGRWTFTRPTPERHEQLNPFRSHNRSNSTPLAGSRPSFMVGGTGLIGAGKEEVAATRPALSFEGEEWRDREGVVIAKSMRGGDGERVLRTCVGIEVRQMDLLVAAWCVCCWGEGGKRRKRRFSLFGS